MQMPSSSVSIQLYNYGEIFTDFYKTYEQRYLYTETDGVRGGYMKIKIYFGYMFDNSAEMLIDGEWRIENQGIDLKDNVLTISAVSRLAFGTTALEDGIFKTKSLITEPLTAEDQGGDYTSEKEIYCEDIKNFCGNDNLKKLLDSVITNEEIKIEYSDKDNLLPGTASKSNAVKNTTSQIFQMCQNMLLCKMTIDRNDIVCFEAGYGAASGALYRLNMHNEPQLKKAATVSSITFGNVFEFGESKKFDGLFGDETYINIDPKYLPYSKTFTIPVDPVENYILKVGACFKGSGPGKRKYTLNSLTITSDNKMSANITVEGVPTTSTKINMCCVYMPKEEMSYSTVISSSFYGENCDITNNIGMPENTNVLVNYYANTNLYNIEQRGNPAIDVGDYMNMELKAHDENGNAKTQKVLILSDELTFDGVYSQKLQVRAINTEFENAEESEE